MKWDVVHEAPFVVHPDSLDFLHPNQYIIAAIKAVGIVGRWGSHRVH